MRPTFGAHVTNMPPDFPSTPEPRQDGTQHRVHPRPRSPHGLGNRAAHCSANRLNRKAFELANSFIAHPDRRAPGRAFVRATCAAPHMRFDIELLGTSNSNSGPNSDSETAPHPKFPGRLAKATRDSPSFLGSWAWWLALGGIESAGFETRFGGRWAAVRVRRKNWHVDCSRVITERGGTSSESPDSPWSRERATWRFLAESEALV